MKNDSNVTQYTVSELNKSIKNKIEGSFQFLKVSGELFEVKKHSSGHIYFNLKDSDSSISGICWRSCVPKIKISFEDGLAVVITGKITTYSPQSKYQLIVDDMKYVGQGDLLKILEERKKKLAAEGFFDANNKKTLTLYPNAIGIITSESGAVFKDIIHRVRDRFPIKIFFYPAAVQGSESLGEICKGIEYFNSNFLVKNNKVDLIIIARGGGSLEDLMVFNEEKLVKKIFESEIPIVSAIGHETDTTLCDFVSDLRAPTPTAAAEMVLPDKDDLVAILSEKFIRLKKKISLDLDIKKQILKNEQNRIPDFESKVNNSFQSMDIIQQKITSILENKISTQKIKFLQILQKIDSKKLLSTFKLLGSKVDIFSEKIIKNSKYMIEKKKISVSSLIRQLFLLSHKATLKRGFAIVRKENKIVKSAKVLKDDEKVQIEFFDDKVNVKKIR
jgi:exodeoxyribonuclease VII large subunit